MDDASKATYPNLRSLGLLEQYSAVRSHLGIYLNVCVTATYRRRHNEALKPALSRGLSAVIAKHPILGATPIDIDNEPRYIQLDQIDLDEIVTFVQRDVRAVDASNEDLLDKVLEDQHNRPFKQQNPPVPFWRIFVLEGFPDDSAFSLCFCFHHSLADTKSAMIFLEDLEYALSNPSDVVVANNVVTCKDMIPPPLESLMELKTSAEFIQRQQNIGEPPTNTWSGAPQMMPSLTRFSSLRLSAASTNNLLRECKSQESSLTAALMSVIAKALFCALPDEYTVVYGDCAVSLRRFLSSPGIDRAMGCYVGSFSETYNRDSCSIWDDAKRTKKTIDETLRRKGADMPVGYLRHVPNLTQWFHDKQGKRRWAAWELSNVGTLNPTKNPSSRLYEIESVLFSQSASACSGAVKVSAATGRDGRLALGFTYQQGIVEDSIIESLKVNMEKMLA